MIETSAALGYDAAMALPLTRKRFTPAEYYALEHDAVYKSDYYDGEIFDMSGGTSTHSLITANLIVALGSRLRGKPCRVYESNLDFCSFERPHRSLTTKRTPPEARSR
ncbi:MAG: Uma2 family endonuclease [Planctomycetota bacterium]|nr:Uma2 family endonuclease [Planctomycetota bacterium]